jgi:hypothetical protein
MAGDSPALRYYRALVGSWSGAFAFRSTGWRQAGAWGLGALGAVARAFGPVEMATTLSPGTAPGQRADHPTRALPARRA